MSEGQTRLGIDAGLTGQPLGTGRIGDYVWHDTNSDGIQDASESGLAGVDVELRDCNQVPLASTTTDANGNYLFDNLLPGNYRVHFDAPPGFAFSPRGQTTGGKDSDANPNTGTTSCRPLAVGQTRLGLDAGLNNQ